MAHGHCTLLQVDASHSSSHIHADPSALPIISDFAHCVFPNYRLYFPFIFFIIVHMRDPPSDLHMPTPPQALSDTHVPAEEADLWSKPLAEVTELIGSDGRFSLGPSVLTAQAFNKHLAFTEKFHEAGSPLGTSEVALR